jgi:hypothetical protein
MDLATTIELGKATTVRQPEVSIYEGVKSTRMDSIH